MAYLTLEKTPAGSRIFIDSTIFIYHFTGSSAHCRRFLERCERSEIKGVTSVIVLAEVAHRLMMIEALNGGLVSGSNLPRKLRELPRVVRSLHVYQEQVERIPLMGVNVLPLDTAILLQSSTIRQKYGLLVNDSLIATAALTQGVSGIATADTDFERLEELSVFRPTDLIESGF